MEWGLHEPPCDPHAGLTPSAWRLSVGRKDLEQVRRFTDEARITASLSHPHIVRVLDHGAEYGVPWIAFELLSGRDLRQILDARPRGLPVADALAAASQVAQALVAAHALGSLHRDVKPDNVMEAGPGHFKLADFGIARWTRGRAVKTATGVILGTPVYIAPELVLGEEAGRASDIYELGVTLFELLAGRWPYEDENVALLLDKHLMCPIPQVSLARPDVPRELGALLERALAKRPQDRFASAGEMAAALDRARARLDAGGTARGSGVAGLAALAGR